MNFVYTMCIEQKSPIAFEVFTIDGLYTDAEIESFENYVINADPRNRTFTSSPFKNGKKINEDLANFMYSRILPFLPNKYYDCNGVVWEFYGAPKYIMYASIVNGQRFGIHTDTGCVYDESEAHYSKFTVLTYLNDNFIGGKTKFYDMNFRETSSISPKKNRTLIFDIDLYHSGEPVVEGTKNWIGTELVCKKVKA